MNKIVHHLGLDVHKETIAVAIVSRNSSEGAAKGIRCVLFRSAVGTTRQ